MNVIYANDNSALELGLMGEKDRTQVIFSFADLAAEFPGGTVILEVQRPDEEDYYNIQPEINGTNAIWTVSDYDLEIRGVGKCQLIYSNGTAIAKRKVWQTSIDRSIEGNNASIPPTWEDIEGRMITAAGELAAESERLREKIDSYDDMTATATQLPAWSSPTAEIDHSGDHPVLVLGLVDGEKGDQGDKGDTGATGNGIASIIKTGTSGLVDTYTITMTDGQTATFTVTNGKDGEDGEDGYSPTASVSKTGDTATITIQDKDGTSSAQISDGVGIQSITKTGTSGNVDTYTITMTNGSTATFTVTNGNAVIDDNAGAGDVTKVWSASKSAGEVTSLSNEITQLGLSVVNGKLCITYEEASA